MGLTDRDLVARTPVCQATAAGSVTPGRDVLLLAGRFVELG